MATDFKSLLNVPMDDIKPPEAWPPGTYHGVIKSHEYGDQNRNRTAYVRFFFSNVRPGSDIDLSGYPDVDFSKRVLFRDFYLTEDARWRLKTFLESCNVEVEGRSLGECIPEAINTPVLITMTNVPSEDGKRILDRITEVVGEGEGA